MVYISADGSVGGKKSTWKWITEFMNTVYTMIALFFATMTDPSSLENSSASNRTYAQRNGGRSYRSNNGSTSGGQSLGSGQRANIRGVKDLGTASCAIGGGG